MKNKNIRKVMGNIIIVLPIFILLMYWLPISIPTFSADYTINNVYEYDVYIETDNANNTDKGIEFDYSLIDLVNDNEVTNKIYNEVMYWNFNNPSKEEAAYIASMIYITSNKYNVDALLVTSMAIVESNLRKEPNKSHAGAIGIMQLMPATASWLDVNPYIFEENLEGGIKFIRYLIDRYDCKTYAIAHYNGGSNPGYAMHNITETRNYVWNVMNIYDNLKE